MRTLLLLLLLFLISLTGGALSAAVPVGLTLPNGLRLQVQPLNRSQLVSITLLIDCSAFDERWPGEGGQWLPIPGMRAVLLSSVMQGAGRGNWKDVVDAVADKGGIIAARVQQDALEFSISIPTTEIRFALAMLENIVCRARLLDTDILAAVAQAQQQLAFRATGLLDICEATCYSIIYGFSHPYAFQGYGHARTLPYMTPEMIRLIAPYFLIPERAVLSVAGDCSLDMVRTQVADIFQRWKKGNNAWPRNIDEQPRLPSSKEVLKESPGRGVALMMSFPVCGMAHEDYVALRVLTALLGGGAGARLYRSVREEKRLAYEVGSRLTENLHGNMLMMYVVSNGNTLEGIRQALIEEVDRLKHAPINDAELQRSRAYVQGLLRYHAQSSAHTAYNNAFALLSGSQRALLDAQMIDKVTVDDLRRVVKTYCTNYALAVVVSDVQESLHPMLE